MKNTNKLIIILIILIFFYFFSQFQKEEIIIDDERIIIPVKVHLIKEELGVYTSSRDISNVIELFEKANKIWEQGNIYLQIEDIVSTKFSVNAIPNALNGNYNELVGSENFDENKMNAFMSQSLNNINGIALFQVNSIMVADFTTVNDYRTTAHEFGHLFGLRHVPLDYMLMARGRNGEFLTDKEIIIARQTARLFLESIQK